MRRPDSLVARIYRVALRVASRSLEEELARDAVEVFRSAWAEARRRGTRATVRFLLTETRSLLRESVSGEDRDRTNRVRGEKGRGRPTGHLAHILDTTRLNARYAFRNLRRSPGFVVVSVLSLTFGIGVSAGLFTLVNTALFRPLPNARAPEELVRIFSSRPGGGSGPFSFPDFLDIRAATETLEDVAVFRGRELILGPASEGARPTEGLEVSGNFFDVLGIPLTRGRAFLTEDVAAGGKVLVLGYHLWMERFHGDPDVLGRSLRVNGEPFTVIGVGPEGMVGPQGPALLGAVIPHMESRDDRGHWSFTGIGRIRAGAGLGQVQQELDAVAARMAEEHPEYWGPGDFGSPGLAAMTPRQAMLPEGVDFFLAAAGFLSVVGLILLIACSNVANLLLTRAWKRRKEVAIRSAMGAPGRRILGQLVTENLLLFGLAGVLSILLMNWITSVVASGAFFLPPAHIHLTVDVRVALFVIGLALITGLTFGLLPALHASRPDLVPALKGREARPRNRLMSARNLLVGVQVGGSLVLVLVSLLLVQSLSHADRMDLGFRDRGVAVMELDLSHGSYQEADGRQFLSDLRQRVESLPGVTETALATRIPLAGGRTLLAGFRPEGYEPAPGEQVTAGMSLVSPGYMDLLGIRLLRGRDVAPEDVAGGERIALVSRTFVSRFWPGEDGVGKTFTTADESMVRVVGVVDDISWGMPGEEPSPFIWFPFSQTWNPRVILHARTQEDPPTLLPLLRQQVAELDPDLPVLRLERMTAITDNATVLHRVLSMVLGLAGAVTLALAMLGIYGVVGFQVSQRTREMGLRIAVGAEPADVIRLVVREGLVLALVGLVPGLILGVIAAALMRAVLLGLQPFDPLAFGGSTFLLLLSVAVASYLPARKAARGDPMDALRVE